MAHNERWLPIAGYEGAYEVSNRGRVRSLARIVPHSHGKSERYVVERLLKPGVRKDGTLVVALCTNGIRVTASLSNLVAAAFLGPRPSGYDICHFDGDSQNNRVENLRYGTRAENEADKIRHGKSNRGERHGMAKLSEAKVRSIFALRAKGASQQKIATTFGVSQATIGSILSRKKWRHITL